MRVVHLVAGAGAMYCGSCLHGNTLVRALRQAGHDAILAPVYTPLCTDEENASTDRVVFGGVNVFLQQRWALFRHTPWLLDRLLDHPRLLGWLGRWALSTQPAQLGALTVSMLRGEAGHQRKELDKLAAWLAQDVRPELVHLSTALLCGTARELRKRLGVPIVCTLSGEDAFLEKLAEPHYGQARAELRSRCRELDALVALSDYYAGFMAEYLGVSRERIHVIPPGLDLEGHAARPETPPPERAPGRLAVIGYLSRIDPDKGLHLLAEAVTILSEVADLPPLRLLAAGYLGASERPYLDEVRQRLRHRGLGERFEYVGQLDRAGKLAFLRSLDLLCVPAVRPESKGLVALEAWASGVPVVLPDHGAFSELVSATGGGLLYDPNRPGALADALRRMILDPALAARCGRQAQAAVHERHTAEQMAQRTIRLYQSL